MHENPLISIVMPTYNRASLILETIQSVVKQSYTNWELIIVDDGSDDETETIIRTLANEKIKYYKVLHTGLLGKVRNSGIEKSGGQYIAFLDSDDLWRKDKLEVQLGLLSNHRQCKFCFSNGDQFGTGAATPPEVSDQSGKLFDSMLLENHFPLYMPSLIVDTDVFKLTGKLDEGYKSGADIDFFYRLAFRFEGVFSNQKLISIRKHHGSNSDNFSELSYVELVSTFENLFKDKMISKSQWRDLSCKAYYRLARHQQRSGNRRKALNNFLRYRSLRPLDWKVWVRIIQLSPLLIRK